MNGSDENPALPLGDVRVGTDKNTKVTLAKSKLKAGKMAMVDFTISRTDGKKPATGMLPATFPKGGDYRLWIQLIDDGDLKTIPLSVAVSK